MSSTSPSTLPMTERDEVILECFLAVIGRADRLGISDDYGSCAAVERLIVKLNPSLEVLERIWDTYKPVFKPSKWSSVNYALLIFEIIALAAAPSSPSIVIELIELLSKEGRLRSARSLALRAKVEPFPMILRR